MIVYLPAIAMVAGLLVYALAGNPKVQEIGRIAFAAGLLALLLQLGGK